MDKIPFKAIEKYRYGLPGGGGTPTHYLYGYVPPNGVVIFKLLV